MCHEHFIGGQLSSPSVCVCGFLSILRSCIHEMLPFALFPGTVGSSGVVGVFIISAVRFLLLSWDSEDSDMVLFRFVLVFVGCLAVRRPVCTTCSTYLPLRIVSAPGSVCVSLSRVRFLSW